MNPPDNDNEQRVMPPAILTHFDTEGQAHMVDIGEKENTRRKASARGMIKMRPETLALISAGNAKKGDVLGIARVAAMMAAKRTADLIPLCHPIALTHVTVDFTLNQEDPAVICIVEAESFGKTGVEMEALTALQIALLTIYDMCKAVDRGMKITDVQVIHKSGGKSGEWIPDM